MNYAPLIYPPEWKTIEHRSLLLGVPLIGPQVKVYNNLCYQILRRDAAWWLTWGKDANRLTDVKLVANKLAEANDWPNAIFISADPFELIVWNHKNRVVDDMSLESVLTEVEEHFVIQLPDERWEQFLKKSFGEVIDFLIEQRHLSNVRA